MLPPVPEFIHCAVFSLSALDSERLKTIRHSINALWAEIKSIFPPGTGQLRPEIRFTPQSGCDMFREPSFIQA